MGESNLAVALHQAWCDLQVKVKVSKRPMDDLLEFLSTINVRTIYIRKGKDEFEEVTVKDIPADSIKAWGFTAGLVAFAELVIGIRCFTGEIISFENINDQTSYIVDDVYLVHNNKNHLVKVVTCHFSVSMGSNVSLGHQAIVYPGAVIGDKVAMGDKVHIQRNAVVNSNTTLCDYAVVNEGAFLHSNVFVGERAVIGKYCRVGYDVSIDAGLIIPTTAVLATTIDGMPYTKDTVGFAVLSDTTTVTLYKAKEGDIYVVINMNCMIRFDLFCQMAVADSDMKDLRAGFNAIMNRAHLLKETK